MTGRAAVAAAILFGLGSAAALADPLVPLDDAVLGASAPQAPRLQLPAIAIRTEPTGRAATHPTTATAPAGPTSSSVVAPATVGGAIRSFAVDMSTAVTTPGATGSTTYAVDQRVGIDLTGATPTVTVDRTDGRTFAAGPAAVAAPDAAVSGTLAGKVAGVAQRISIAGNGNSVLNAATVDVTGGSASAALAQNVRRTGAAPCGTNCSATAGSGGVGVSVTTSYGIASQSLGAGSLAQDATIAGSGATVINQLRLAVGVAPASSRATLPTLASGLGVALPVILPH